MVLCMSGLLRDQDIPNQSFEQNYLSMWFDRVVACQV
jgi:hypothetical protein